MATPIPLPVGSYVVRDPRASSKRLVNMFSEPMDTTTLADSKQQNPTALLRRAAGISPFATDGSGNPVRGFRTMGNITYVVIGPTLYTMSATGALTRVGTGITGSSFVRIVDNTQCLFILVPGTNVAYTYCPNGLAPYFSQYSNPTFNAYGALDVWFVDSYFVFLEASGRGFYNDDGQIISGLGPPTFTTNGIFPREFGTDLYVGMCVDHREILMFGKLTSEGYVNVGNPTNSPFSSAPDGFMQIGCHPQAGYSIALQDQSVFWVANDRTVRRRSGQTPTRVSNSGIESILEKANLAGCYALTPSIGGHPFWILTMPAQNQSIAFDCLTQEWWEPSSFGIGYWTPLCWYNEFGVQLVGDSQGNGVGFLDTTVFSEFSTPQIAVFTTQSVYSAHDRIQHRRLELVITAGGQSNLTLNPQVTLYISDDGGVTFYPGPMRSLGQTGQYQNRVTWFNLGQSRDRVYRFEISDAAPLYTVDILAEVEGGKW